ncbi:MFS general substrate transporter [Ceratobasidium sp. AG-I]|nr:MFS general substrate transporter [Ceratobasidium sp. AG-I]
MPTHQARRQASQIFDTTHEEDGGDDDMRSALDRTIDKIGMGPYQWALLGLCGFGWAADNMWLQAIAIILPRVQDEYAVSDSRIGLLSSSVFCGMMFGALGWGSCSDIVGRSMAFNLTLAFTSLFGVMACFATSFGGLCFLLFLLGSAVGGSMPTDGTLFLENVPKKKQYLLTALSLFFSMGAVVSAIIAIIIIPNNSCPENLISEQNPPPPSLIKLAYALGSRAGGGAPGSGNSTIPPTVPLCDVAVQNRGWKYLLATLGIITLVMFTLRIIFFKLYESPRYLVAAGRKADAVSALQSIEDYNQKHTRQPARVRFVITLADVCDIEPSAMQSDEGVVFDIDDEESALVSAPQPLCSTDEDKVQNSGSDKDRGRSEALSEQLEDRIDYRATDNSPEGIVGEWSFHTPAPLHADESSYFEGKHGSESVNQSEASSPTTSRSRSGSRLPRVRRPPMQPRPRSSIYVEQTLPSGIGRPIAVWLDRVGMLFTPKWRLTTILVWCAWWGMSLAFTMFNVYLPKLLEQRLGGAGSEGGRKEAMWDIVIFTLGGCPGALLGAWMIESPLGRRKSLALSTFVTALFCLAFVQVESKMGVMLSTIGISLASTVMWAVLYGMTPEIFDTKIRGTACGTASAINRVGGMIAPVAGGILMSISPSLPVYTSIGVFLFTVVCVLLLPFEKSPAGDDDAGADGRGDYSALH